MTKRVQWYDFKRVTVDDLRTEQNAWLSASDSAVAITAGSGVVLDSIVAPVIWDSTKLTTAQNAQILSNTFDGRGILAVPVPASDSASGNQLCIELIGTNTSHTLPIIVTILGTDFSDNIKYEHVVCESNKKHFTYNHFKVIQNILFQNAFGNTDTTVDGFGSFALVNTGSILITEATSLSPALNETIACFQQPDQIFSKYKLYNPALNLTDVLEQALNSAYNVDDLGIETTVTNPLGLSQGVENDLMYIQPFKMYGNNIQNIKLLLSLTSGANWSGSITVGVRKLYTPESLVSCGKLLPTNPWQFEPETTPLSEVSLDQADLLDLGVVLNASYKEVNFSFSETLIGNANLSPLVDSDWYCITVNRSNSTAVGNIQVASSYMSSTDLYNNKNKIFSPFPSLAPVVVSTSPFSTATPQAQLYYKVETDAMRAVSGRISDHGRVAKNEKVILGDYNVLEQDILRSTGGFASTSTGVYNYGILEATAITSDPEAHPKSGDLTDSRSQDLIELSALVFDDVESLMDTKPDLVVAVAARDLNPRGNPTITGTSYYPGLFIRNTLDIPNPPADLLNYNVVGSIVTPNTNKSTLKYRVTKQEIYVDGYGDLNSDGEVNLLDLARESQLDGYSVTLTTTGSYSSASQKSNMSGGLISAIELMKANLNSDALVNTADIAALTDFIDNGTVFPNGMSNFNRVRLTLEPMTNQMSVTNTNGTSSLRIDLLDTDLLNTWTVPVAWSIQPVSYWRPDQVEFFDIRRFALVTATEFEATDLLTTPPNGGQNNTFIPGNLVLAGSVLNSDGTNHGLDYERAILSLELPDGNTEKELNVFEVFVKNKMKFSDNSLVTQEALTDGQVLFEVSVSSYAKNMGLAVDGYVDYSGPGEDADEAIGTYIDQATGLLRVRAYNIVNNDILPEVRTRIIVTVNLKKAGWKNPFKSVSDIELAGLWI